MVTLLEPLGCQSKPERGKTPTGAAGLFKRISLDVRRKRQSLQNLPVWFRDVRERKKSAELWICRKDVSA